MKSLQAIRLVLLLLTIPTLWGCNSNSTNLSKSKAKSLIVKAYSLPKSEFAELKKEYYYTVNSWPKEMLNELQSKGLITLHDSIYVGLIEESTGVNPISKVVELTDEGKKYLSQEKSLYSDGSLNTSVYKLKSCDISFGEVTDIQIQEKGEEGYKIAIVNYTIIRKNITPFGNNLSQSPEKRSDTFSLDSGVWELNS